MQQLTTGRRPASQTIRKTILGCALFTALAGPSYGQIERSFDTGAGGSLQLSAESAAVQVDTNGGSVVTVRVERWRGSEPIENDFGVTMASQGSGVVVKIEKRDKYSWGSNNGLKVSVSLPRRYDLDISTSGGSLQVSDLDGDVLAQTSGGSVSLGAILGSVKAMTSGGSITLSSSSANAELSTSGGFIRAGDISGSVDANTSGGSIHIARAEGDVTASTSGGSITLGEIYGAINAETSGGSITATFSSQPSARSRLSTSGGTVRVKLAPGLSFDLDARSSSKISSAVPVDVHGTMESNRLKGKVNGGGPALVLRASGGKIVISER